MERKEIFISYKSEDYDQAQWLRSVLEANGLSCWMAPASIPGGSNYAKEIPMAIENCRVFVVVLTRKCQESIWVPKELDRALNCKKPVMPFVLENCELTDDFNFYLSNVQRYQAYQNKVAAAERMLRDIRALLGVPQEPAPVRMPEKPEQKKASGKLSKILLPVAVVVVILALLAAFLPKLIGGDPTTPDVPQKTEEMSPAPVTDAPVQTEESSPGPVADPGALKAADVAAIEEKARKFINGRGTGYPEIRMNDGSTVDLNADKLANCMTDFSFLEQGYVHISTPLFDTETVLVIPFSLQLEDVPFEWFDNVYYEEGLLMDYPALYGYFSFTDLMMDDNGDLIKEGSFGVEMSDLYENRDTMEMELASRHFDGELISGPLQSE